MRNGGPGTPQASTVVQSIPPGPFASQCSPPLYGDGGAFVQVILHATWTTIVTHRHSTNSSTCTSTFVVYKTPTAMLLVSAITLELERSGPIHSKPCTSCNSMRFPCHSNPLSRCILTQVHNLQATPPTGCKRTQHAHPQAHPHAHPVGIDFNLKQRITPLRPGGLNQTLK